MIVVNGFDGNAFGQNSVESLTGRFIKCFYRLALSGSYATGGDTLDFTNAGVNSAVPPQGRTIEGIAIKGHAASSTTFFGEGGIAEVIGVPGSTANNAWKLKLLSAISTECSAGAYGSVSPASPLTDTIELEVIWAR